jgi:hypothetical protein
MILEVAALRAIRSEKRESRWPRAVAEQLAESALRQVLVSRATR